MFDITLTKLDSKKNIKKILNFRWRNGVASGLNYIDLPSNEMSPKLNPYPSWDANLLSNKLSESSIISPFRIQADECDRLWVLDTGFNDFLGDYKQVTPISIVVFDLNTDQVVTRFEIPKSQLKEDSFVPNLVSLRSLILILFILHFFIIIF